jgi:xanthine dehydrogenase FAD-binding subunit
VGEGTGVMEALHPASLAEALEARSRLRAVPFAGGTDLMVRLSRGAGVLPGFKAPVLFLDRCAELAGISATDGMLEIGAMTTLAEIAESPLVHPVLREIVLSMGGPGIRNAATLGGNLCNASPAGDTIPFLYAFEASVRIASARGERTVPVADFVTGPGATRLAADEIVRSIRIPSWQPRVAFWRKVGTRRANALTKVSVTGFADVTGGRLRRVRIALGAAAPTVLRLGEVERLLEQAEPGSDAGGLVGRARAAAAAAARPIGDQRSTAEYRREVAASLAAEFARRALEAMQASSRSPS